MLSDFHFHVPESFHKKWFRSAKQFLRKSGLNFCMYTTLGQGQEMTLAFNTHIPSYMQLRDVVDVCSFYFLGHWLH